MQDVTTLINEYIRSELLILVPVLYIITKNLDSSSINKRWIPIILMLISVVLAGIYTFASVDISSLRNILMALFSTVVQGVLLSGTTVFSGLLAQSMKKPTK